MGKLNKTFEVPLQKSNNTGSWTYVVWPESIAFFKTKGLVKVSGTMDGEAFISSFMALGNGTHKLPVKAAILKKIAKKEGDVIKVHLMERIEK